jgi:hypothetical protein
LNRILKSVNTLPRKLHYPSLVSFLQYNRPQKFKHDAEEFLFHCFDINTGEFTKNTVAFMLWKMGVLRPVDAKAPAMLLEEKLFPDMEESELDEIRKSKDKLLSGESWDNNPLPERDDVGALKRSVEGAANHECASD